MFAGRATFELSLPTLTPDLPSPSEGPQVDQSGPQTCPAKQHKAPPGSPADPRSQANTSPCCRTAHAVYTLPYQTDRPRCCRTQSRPPDARSPPHALSLSWSAHSHQPIRSSLQHAVVQRWGRPGHTTRTHCGVGGQGTGQGSIRKGVWDPKVCTKNGPTRFSLLQISFFPTMVWRGGGPGVGPPPPTVYGRSNTSLGLGHGSPMGVGRGSGRSTSGLCMHRPRHPAL